MADWKMVDVGRYFKRTCNHLRPSSYPKFCCCIEYKNGIRIICCLGLVYFLSFLLIINNFGITLDNKDEKMNTVATSYIVITALVHVPLIYETLYISNGFYLIPWMVIIGYYITNLMYTAIKMTYYLRILAVPTSYLVIGLVVTGQYIYFWWFIAKLLMFIKCEEPRPEGYRILHTEHIC
ncbi:uncharacterized protein LOC143920154 [Arctopsyche grandis]|uniref:uncharacterized protein LOC143920154 n=1 Tax=Arctopsyche grandis TaxID=121162 RepID=UPI00406D6EFB